MSGRLAVIFYNPADYQIVWLSSFVLNDSSARLIWKPHDQSFKKDLFYSMVAVHKKNVSNVCFDCTDGTFTNKSKLKETKLRRIQHNRVPFVCNSPQDLRAHIVRVAPTRTDWKQGASSRGELVWELRRFVGPWGATADQLSLVIYPNQ